MEFLLIPAVAVLLDVLFGDPPNAVHPVAWMGKVISLLEKPGLQFKPVMQFLYGIFITIFTICLFTLPVYFLLHYLHGLNMIAYVAVAAFILKSVFTIRGLNRAALQIRSLLLDDDLVKTRFELRALVSRDTAGLQTPLLVSAAVESVAEGSCDSVVAPLFFYLILGVPGAVAYRVVNTFDSMIGYHGRYEYLGKFAARLDDVLNYIPARLAALFLVIAAAFCKNTAVAWNTAYREHRKTASPNAGWPMAAMAGALGVRLEKVGHYVLGDGNKTPVLDDISAAARIFSVSAGLWIIVCLAAGGLRFAVTA